MSGIGENVTLGKDFGAFSYLYRSLLSSGIKSSVPYYIVKF